VYILQLGTAVYFKCILFDFTFVYIITIDKVDLFFNHGSFNRPLWLDSKRKIYENND